VILTHGRASAFRQNGPATSRTFYQRATHGNPWRRRSGHQICKQAGLRLEFAGAAVWKLEICEFYLETEIKYGAFPRKKGQRVTVSVRNIMRR
jgi:hypothetical protein